jgi:3-hydroxyisobutyrate dehydrogenase
MATDPSLHVAPVSVSTRLGWIGTGVMGVSMCGHLMARGYPATVFNRTRTRAQPLLDNGAAWADSPAAVAERSDIVFTMVGFPSDVRGVYFGDDGLLKAVRAGMVLVDMTTTEPNLAREIYRVARAKGVAAIDAPVSGGDVGARNAALSIMIGGDKDVVEAVTPLFQSMGRSIVYQGGAGAGQHTKMCSQIVLAAEMIGVCESLLYGYKAGLDLETMLTSLRGGAAACWVLENLAPRILKRNFDPGFFVEHFIKDLGIVLDEAKRMHLVLPGLALVHQLYLAVQAQGHGRLGTHALMIALEQMSQTEVKPRVPTA